MRLPPQKETAIQAAILVALQYHRSVYAWRNNTGALPNKHGRPVFFGKTGSADVLGVTGPTGRFFALEVKRPGKTATDEQEAFAAEVRARGGFYRVVCSVEEALDALAAAQRGEE